MSSQFYKPAEACKMAEVAPYVLRYWETEFPALSEGKEKGSPRSYTQRDVLLITRIRELLYDEGFTVAGAKKRLDAEIAQGRFDDGLKAAAPPAEQRASGIAAVARAETPRSREGAAPVPATVIESTEMAFLAEAPPAKSASGGKASASTDVFSDRKHVLRELKDIVKLLDRSRKK